MRAEQLRLSGDAVGSAARIAARSGARLGGDGLRGPL